MERWRHEFLFLFFLAMGFSTRAAWGQSTAPFEICLPGPIQLPGFSSAQPPDWANVPGLCSNGNPCSDSSDPRWAAAPLYPLQSGNAHVAFRALRTSSNELYLQVRCTLGGASNRTCTLGSDKLALALGGSTPVILLGTLPTASCGNNVPCSISSTVFLEHRGTAGVFSAVSGAASSITKAHVWQKDTGWIANFHLTLPSSVTALAVGARLATPSSASPLVYRWPSCSSCRVCSATSCLDGLVRLDTAGWAAVSEPCDGARVVDLASSNIGTRATPGGPLGMSINYGATETNTFVARPEMGSSTWPADLVRGEFRLADWGSTVGASGRWGLVTPGSSKPVTGEISQTCAPGDAGCMLPTSSVSNQCMLVQLSAGASFSNGQPPLFTTAAVFRSSLVVNASTVDRLARIDLSGLEQSDVLAQEPEVIFRARMQNLPAPERVPFSLPLAEMERVLREVESGVVPLLPPDYQQPSPEAGAYRVDPLDEYMASVWPTLEILPFYKTSEIQIVDDVPREVYEPMTPFALQIRHEGSLLGFEFALTDESGINLLEEPLRRFEESSALVRLSVTAVEASETTPNPGPGLPELQPPGLLPSACSVGGAGSRDERLPTWATWTLIAALLRYRRAPAT